MSNYESIQVKHGTWQSGGILFWSAIVALMLLASVPTAGARSKAGPRQVEAARDAAPDNLAEAPGATWTFAVSGDSRNCGDVVMPEIAAGAHAHDAAFYWHLGDFRLGSDVDQDMTNEEGYRGHHVSVSRYLSSHWNDFIQNQLLPFGQTPVFLAIGNHESHFKTRQDYLVEFANWLNTPVIQKQRLEDNSFDYGLRTYYHWKIGGVDFFSMDNAGDEQFDTGQVRWFESALKRDEADPNVHTIVLGMHEPLPHGVSPHSMDESAQGIESGSQVYKDLLQAEQQSHKHVYVIAAHLHAYIADAYNTEYWKTHGGVLPGWIIGTAGASRVSLSRILPGASEAMTNVYGYVVGTVNPPGSDPGSISFKFYQVKESDVPRAVVDKFTPELTHWCFEENRSGGSPAPTSK